MPTAAVTDRRRVASNVVENAMREVAAVRQIVSMAPRRRDDAAANISTAASVGIATYPTIPENSTRITTIQTPDRIDAQRDRAPAVTLSAV